jgi:hypothetical protein
MYWPPLIDGAELMIAPASLAEQHHGARDFLGLTESIDGNQINDWLLATDHRLFGIS